MAKSKVAVIKVKPETVLDDIHQLNELAGMKDALDPSAGTILKDNISWHFPFPGANTTPWQLEGTISPTSAPNGWNHVVALRNTSKIIIFDPVVDPRGRF